MIAQEGIRDELNKVVRYYYDAKEDYRLAAKRASDKAQVDLFADLCARRERYHHELQLAETTLGIEMSDNGHVGADFKRDWERVRGAVAGHGLEAALQLAHTSDLHAANQIDALLAFGVTGNVGTILRSHLQEIRPALAQVESALATLKARPA
ncbi:MAG: DUF2383 domain-containing protein [Burkholderiales bacterium]|nr:DUF2383 domain-containing protein [Phycisphaerae bacterium]